MLKNTIIEAFRKKKYFFLVLAYALVFFFLYSAVLKFFPYNSAVSILNKCPSNFTAHYTNVALAPFSYFEIIIIAQRIHLSGNGLLWLIGSNIAFVFIGAAATILFIDEYSLRYKKKFNVNKIIASSVLATWALTLTFIPCGTGISVIGVSLTLFAGIAIFKEALYLKSTNQMDGRKRISYSVFIVITLTIAGSYIVSGPVQHLLGLLWFMIILSILDSSFRKIIRRILHI